MDKDEYEEPSEVDRSIYAWTQSERKVMIDTVSDLIRTSHKYSKSQYTPNVQRVRWTKLAGQLIWYKDQILKSFSLESLTIQLQELEKKAMESEKRRELESLSRHRPMIVFGEPRDGKANAEKAKGGEAPRAAKASGPEGGEETVSGKTD